MRVAVLGAGPAGLMSCAALHDTRVIDDLVIFADRNRPSRMYGAQYLHAPIPHYTPTVLDQAVPNVAYRLQGTSDDYRRKVYGPMWDGTVSPEDLEESHPAWDLRETYHRLWDDFGSEVEEMLMDPAGMSFLTSGNTRYGKFDLIISSIPKPAVCPKGHQFKSAQIWAAGEAPELGITLPYKCPEFTVICNGDDEPSWYRMSNIYGRTTVEWPEWIRPPLPHVASVIKPLENNCDCWPDVLHVGRYGKWEKGVLTHNAYEDVVNRVKTSV